MLFVYLGRWFPSHVVSLRYLSWISGVTDNALYPVLIVDYLLQMIGALQGLEERGFERMITLFGITALLTYLNYRGLDVVGVTAIAICGFSLAPFVVMVLVGIFKVDVNRLAQLPLGGEYGRQRWSKAPASKGL